jgi:hypothetical protein
MIRNDRAFEIDDALGTSDNLASFEQSLAAIDAPLGRELSTHLASLAAGQPVNTVAIWNALYAAMAPADPIPPIANGAADGQDKSV